MISALFIFYAVFYFASLMFLLWIQLRHKKWFPLFKGLQSLQFLIASITAFSLGKQISPFYFAFFFAGLLACATGDVLLGLANRHGCRSTPAFAGGITSFLLAHILFCCLYYQFVRFSVFDILLPVAAIFVLFGFERVGWIQTQKLLVLVYLYAGVLTLMTCKAFALYKLQLFSLGYLFFLGSVLFFVSDFILLFLYFGKSRNRILGGLNLLTYYSGVFLLSVTAFCF